VLLAVIATVVSARGAHGDPDVLLLALALAAGVVTSLQAAANGQLARASGEPWAASLVNVAVGLATLAVVALVTLATSEIDTMPGNPLLYGGGLLGAFIVVISATAVRTLGVVRLGLAMVAGQTAGALVVDLIAPVRGEPVTAATLIGVALTMLAVAVSGRGRTGATPPEPIAAVPELAR
jgi:bacterial/archaeal transporter family-2 protein